METTDELLTTNFENNLFTKLLDIDVNADLAKKIMSFWMFLKSKDLKEIYDKLYVAEKEDFGCACEEAERVLAFIESGQMSTETPISCPITSALAGPNLSLPNILQDRENVYNEMLNIHDRVCNIAFKDIMDKRGLKDKDLDINIAKRDDGEGASGEKDMHDDDNGNDNESLDLIPTQQQPLRSTLNPNAKEWTPSTEGPSLEDRSLFMTFSRGHPLSRGEIINYFQGQYGDCVEDIFIHQPRDREAEFGKIVFKVSSIPALILQGRQFERVYIGARTLFLKKYHPSS